MDFGGARSRGCRVDAKMFAPYGHVQDLEKPPPLDTTLAVLQDSVPVGWRCFKDRNAVT